LNTQKIGGIENYFRHLETERLYSIKNLYPVKLRESPRTTFVTAEQGRGNAAAVDHILHRPSPTRHYEINASVTIKNNPLALEMDIIYVKCEYFTNQKG
jgi:hypothetical protein